PYVLYNLGGVIMNLAVGAAGLALWFIFPRVPVLSVFLMSLFAVGVMISLTNGVPMSVGMMNNDGLNALSLGKDLHALRSFANQLRVNARMAKGERLRDMPCGLFELAQEADAANPINATINVFACNRLVDEHRFAEARELCEALAADEAVLPIYKNMLTCDLAFCECSRANATARQADLPKSRKSLWRRWLKTRALYARGMPALCFAKRTAPKRKNTLPNSKKRQDRTRTRAI
ncbi:MAG: hypothetical protein IJW21_01620, partial [Clostridia bacterium]|nr:hypothetical protein [Clostridia bacterium]